jgi:two-component system LytT family response regulator
MNIRALIVDDEAPARDELAYLLRAHPDVLAGQAASADAALDLLAGGDFDLVFQDIQMPGHDGFHVLAEAQNLPRPPLFVFVTAFNQHAIRAFEENAVDYLLKPLSPERLAKSLERARRLLALGGPAARPSAAAAGDGLSPQDQTPFRMARDGGAPETGMEAASGQTASWSGPEDLRAAMERLLLSAGRPKALPRLAVEQGGRISLIPLAKVSLIEAEEKRVAAVTDLGRLTCHGLPTLAKACERLAGLPFFQANRAQLINLERIAEFAPWFGGKYSVTLNDPDRTEVTVSRNRAREFKARLGI